jgi:heat shock protein HslJ
MNNTLFVRGVCACLTVGVMFSIGCSKPEPAIEESEVKVAAEDPAEAPQLELRMLVGLWGLSTLGGEAIAGGLEVPTLEIASDGGVAGFSGVNRYMTKVDAEAFFNGRLVFGPTAGTMMAGPPEAMDLESAYLQRLGAVTGYFIEGDELRLSNDEDEVLMTFTRSTN